MSLLLKPNSAKIKPRQRRSLLLLRLCGRVCAAGKAKFPSDHIVEGEPNRSARNRDRSYYVLVYLGVEEQKVLKCVLMNQRGSHSKIHHTEEDSGCSTEGRRRKIHSTQTTSGKLLVFLGTSHTHLEARKPIVCGLSARGIIPPLPQKDTDDDVADITPNEVEVVEISDEEEEEEEDMVELSSEEYRSNMGYLSRVEESEDDIAPEYRRILKRMHEEEKKLREEKFKVTDNESFVLMCIHMSLVLFLFQKDAHGLQLV
ncbi:hypothetical protein Bca101_042481 [Brassica carinata]